MFKVHSLGRLLTNMVLMCMESNAFEKSTNNCVALRCFAQIPLMIHGSSEYVMWITSLQKCFDIYKAFSQFQV